LDDEKKKTIMLSMKEELAKVRQKPMTSASRPPDQLRLFLFMPLCSGKHANRGQFPNLRPRVATK
jgi:hypothetical protein